MNFLSPVSHIFRRSPISLALSYARALVLTQLNLTQINKSWQFASKLWQTVSNIHLIQCVELHIHQLDGCLYHELQSQNWWLTMKQFHTYTMMPNWFCQENMSSWIEFWKKKKRNGASTDHCTKTSLTWSLQKLDHTLEKCLAQDQKPPRWNLNSTMCLLPTMVDLGYHLRKSLD